MESETLKSTARWRWWLPPAALSLALALVFQDPFAGDWDALDYTVLAVQGRPSSMFLGRTFFIFLNHGLWRVAHTVFALPPEDAYLLFKYAVIIQSPLAIIAWWWLSHELTNSVRTATVAALLLASSSFFIIYSGQAMAEIPSLLLLAVALAVHLRGLRSRRVLLVLSGAVLLGAGVNLREGAMLYAPWLVIAPVVCGWGRGRREVAITLLACLVFLLVAFGPFALLLLTNAWNYRWSWHGWVESSRLESARHPVAFGNIYPLLQFFFVAAPLALLAFPVAAFKEWKLRGMSPLLLLAVIGLLANLSLIIHYSVVINGRYMLTGAPALVPLAADYFVRSQQAKLKSASRAFWVAVAGVAVVAVMVGIFAWPISRGYVEGRALARDYRAQLAQVPRDAVVIPGGQTIALIYWRGLGAGEWEMIGVGSSWPGERLAEVIDAYLKDGRRVFLDADPRWWSPVGWQQQEARELASVEAHFRFRRVSDTIYEIKLPDDEAARDTPHLNRLLPENRSGGL